MTNDSKSAQGLYRITDWAGFILLFLLIFLVPVFFISPKLFQVSVISAEVQFYKEVAIRLLSTGLLLVTAVHLFGVIFSRYRTILVGYLLGGAFVCLSLLAVLMSRTPTFALRSITTELVLWGAVACAPLYINSARRVRTMLLAGTISATLAASIACLSIAGFTLPYELIYGADPVTIAKEGLQAEMGYVEGGAARAATMSTLGNPEYAGNFYAAGLLLAGCWLLDGFGSRRLRSTAGWVAALACFSILAFAMIQSQTRTAVIVVIAGLVVRWISGLPVRGWVIAAWLLASIIIGFIFGLPGAIILFILGAAAVLFWQIKSHLFMSRWNSIPKPSRVLLAAVPIAAVALLIAVVFVTPLRVRVAPLAERFTSGLSTEDRSARERLIFYMMAGELAKEHPLLGVGPGFFPAYYHEALVDLVASDPTGVMAYNQILLAEYVAYETHNDYFQIAAERGIIALACFLGFMTFLLSGLVRLVRSRHALAAPASALSVVLAGYLTMMITSFPLLEAARLVSFLMLIAVSLSLIAHSSHSSPSEIA